MSKLERRAERIMQAMHGDVVNASPALKAAGAMDVRDALIPWACRIAVAEAENRRAIKAIKETTRVLKALADEPAQPRPRPVIQVHDQAATAETLRGLAQIKLNGSDLHREVRRGEVPQWHPES